jgi:hypothetical protein
MFEMFVTKYYEGLGLERIIWNNVRKRKMWLRIRIGGELL